jgi:MFS family permease
MQAPVFRRLWFASVASNFGTLIQSVGAAWLMTTLVHASDMVAFVQAATALPVMLLSIPAGAIADIWDRRVVMLVAQVVSFVVALLISVLAFQGLVTPWLLLGLTFLLGCGGALYGPAWQASVSEQVPVPLLPQAVALNALGYNLARTVGPALGGVIVASAGAEAAFLFNTASYLGLIVVVGLWRRSLLPIGLPPERMVAAIGAGVRYARLSAPIRAVLVRAALFGFGAGGLWSTMPLVARDLLQGGPRVFGILLGAFGAGAVVAALASTALRRRWGHNAVASSAGVLFGLASALVALSPWLAGTLLLMAVAGAAWVLSFSTYNVVTQVSSPRWVVGRTLALYQTAAFGGAAAGAWVWGMVAEWRGLRGSLIAAGLILVVASLMAARRYALVAHAPEALGPLQVPEHGATGVGISPDAGPIVVTVEYRVEGRDIAEFVRAAHELGRVRRRDGARRWSLMQDLDSPDRFVERYQVLTWLDHQRLWQRAVAADREVHDRARRLHVGPSPPEVRYLLVRHPDTPEMALSVADV